MNRSKRAQRKVAAEEQSSHKGLRYREIQKHQAPNKSAQACVSAAVWILGDIGRSEVIHGENAQMTREAIRLETESNPASVVLSNGLTMITPKFASSPMLGRLFPGNSLGDAQTGQSQRPLRCTE